LRAHGIQRTLRDGVSHRLRRVLHRAFDFIADPGMPKGKPAGVRCVQLLADYRCALFGRPERPAVCASLRPDEAMCGARREDALSYLAELEEATRPV
jgi:uncharacterized protein